MAYHYEWSDNGGKYALWGEQLTALPPNPSKLRKQALTKTKKMGD